MQTVKAIKKVLRTRYVGPSPTFSELHVVRAMLLLDDRGSMGRAALARSLGLGLGAARTLIERLRLARIIKVERAGCVLTRNGKEIHRRIKAAMTPPQKIGAGKLAVDAQSAAVLVRGMSHNVTLGLEQRDAAVRAGATGAMTIIFRRGKYIIPDSSKDAEKEFPDEIWRRISELLEPKNDDVIIVCSAESEKRAEYGALAAALTLLQ